MTQFVLYYDILILRNQLHICVNVSHIYKLSGLNLTSQRPYLRYSVFTVISSKKEWISKQKHNKLTCTENLMIKLWTAILLSVEVEPFVCSREHNLSEIFIVPLVLYFNLCLCAMLEFCRIYMHLNIKKEKKACFKTLHKGSRWKHFILRVQGLTLASDGDYDKHDA